MQSTKKCPPAGKEVHPEMTQQDIPLPDFDSQKFREEYIRAMTKAYMQKDVVEEVYKDIRRSLIAIQAVQVIQAAVLIAIVLLLR